MEGPELIGWSVAAYAGLPLVYALRRTPGQSALLYAHLATLLTFGSLFGGLYRISVTDDLVLQSGELSYGGFLFAAIVTVVVGRDLQVVRNIISLTAAVGLLGLVVFVLVDAAPPAPDVSYASETLFTHRPVEALIYLLFILGELLLLLSLVEAAKKRLPAALMAVTYPAVFVLVMALHGTLTALLDGAPVGDGLVRKLVVTAFFLPPLLVFVSLYRASVTSFESCPLRLRHLASFTRNQLLEELQLTAHELAQQRSAVLATTASVGRVSATVDRILDSATTTILIALDAELRITHFNVGAQRLLGWTAEEVCGQGLEVLLPAEEIARHASALGTAAELSQVIGVQMAVGARRDWSFLAKNDTCPTISLAVTEVIVEGQLVGHVAAGEDVTSRLRVETAMMTALSREHDALIRLQEADRVKNELVSTVSHELRTPIASITGYTEMLHDGAYGALSNEQVTALGRVLRNTARLEQLVDDLLVLERVESAPLPLDCVPLDLSDVIRSTQTIVAEMVRGRDLKFSVSLPALPVVINGDRAALERLVINLLSNAVKFTPGRGLVTLRVTVDQETAWLTVSDTGLGVAPEDQPQLFARFFRAHQANELAIPGSGLGLSIVHAVATGHGGEISLTSVPGKGTTFTVSLPLEAGAAVGATVGAEPRAQLESGTSQAG